MNNESQEGFTPQYQMECAVAKADKDSGKAVLFIPEMEELFYINPDDVFRDSDNLFTLRSGRIPDGLMPPERAEDKVQLSKVLARVLSMQAMCAAGTMIHILTVDTKRPRVDNGQKIAPDENSLFTKYKNCLKVYKISKEFYEDNKYGVGRANYSYSKNGEFKVAAVTLRTQNQAEPVNPRSCIINANDILRAVQAEERRCQRPGFKPRKKVVLKNPRNGG